MMTVIITSAFVLITCALAHRADLRFRNEDRLPMQWGFGGQVNWSAPRRFALALMPVLATAILGFFAVMALSVPARAGQEGLVLPVLLGMGVTFVVIQLFHFWLIARTLRRPVE